jgi:hypothetical protein
LPSIQKKWTPFFPKGCEMNRSPLSSKGILPRISGEGQD